MLPCMRGAGSQFFAAPAAHANFLVLHVLHSYPIHMLPPTFTIVPRRRASDQGSWRVPHMLYMRFSSTRIHPQSTTAHARARPREITPWPPNAVASQRRGFPWLLSPATLQADSLLLGAAAAIGGCGGGPSLQPVGLLEDRPLRCAASRVAPLHRRLKVPHLQHLRGEAPRGGQAEHGGGGVWAAGHVRVRVHKRRWWRRHVRV